MKSKRLILPIVFLVANCSLVFAQTETAQPAVKILRNADIIRMHKSGLNAGQIIAKIVISHCNFDTFPPVLRELKMRGLPDTVVMAMVMVPYGPPATTPHAVPVAEAAPRTAQVQIPAGTLIRIEPVSPVSSADAVEGDQIKFLVSRRVMVNGVLVIERGAAARARVIKSKSAAAWGRGGLLSWVLEDVVAVDGSRVPIKLSDHLSGKNRSKAVVAAAIATGAAILPYSSPVGLIWALKKGDEAVLYENRKSNAVVSSNTEIAGLLPKSKRAILHPAEQLKTADRTPGLAPMNNSFRPSSIGKH